MSEFVFKLPDLGEGTVEAEIVEWHVNVGDVVKEGDVIVDVMTDKANVEVPAPVDGKVLRTSGEPGDIVAVGSELIALEASGKVAKRARQADQAAPSSESEAETPAAAASEEKTADVAGEAPARKLDSSAGDDESADHDPATETEAAGARAAPAPEPAAETGSARSPSTPGRHPPRTEEKPAGGEGSSAGRDRVITSPAIRRRAKEAGIDLRDVAGSGPRGRILRGDLDAVLERGERPAAGGTRQASAPTAAADEFEESKVIGVRRVIAERMSQSKREIPHFAYVEEVDVTELEALRRHLNAEREQRLTVLPFIAMGLLRALIDFPQCNARFDAERGMLQRFRPVHLGIATQTPDGLKVPVVRDARRLDLWQLAVEIARVAEAARNGKAGRDELSGSTITITSLGRMGGIVTTPVINYPEVGVIGVNKAAERPMVVDGQIGVRTMMNLSSSFDHRFVDGFDAAAMIQRLKSLLEHPATLFLDPPEGT